MDETYLTAKGLARGVVVLAALIGAHNTAEFFSKDKLKAKEEALLDNISNDVEGYFRGMRRISFKRGVYSVLGYAIVLGAYFYGCY